MSVSCVLRVLEAGARRWRSLHRELTRCSHRLTGSSRRCRPRVATQGVTGARSCLDVSGDKAADMIDYRILGPLEVSANGRAVEIGGLKQRALLAILLLRANQSVSRDVLVRELWGEQPPAGARHSLEVCVSRLRKTLDAAAAGPVLVTRPGAYRLQVADGQLDVTRFERLVADGRRAPGANAPEQAAASLRGALALWRGQPL